MTRGTQGIVLAATGWVALAAASAGAAPFTAHFVALRAAMEARLVALESAPEPDAVRQRNACVSSLGRFIAYSGSVDTDLKVAGKVAKALEKAFPPGDPLLDELSGALDGLEGELAPHRDILVVEISLLSGAAKEKAAKGLALADVLVDRADLAATRALRARYLGSALKKILATRRALRGAGTPGFQGPLNGSFEDEDPFAVFPEPGGVMIRNASNSFAGYLDLWKTAGGAVARTGIGAPHGVAKASVGASYSINTGYHPGSLFQEGVNLSRSRLLRFEWELSGTMGTGEYCVATGKYKRALVEVRFSAPSGTTATLLRLDLEPNAANGTFNYGTTSAVVELPYLPEPGTLTFHAGKIGDYCPPPPPTPPGGNPTEGGSNWGYAMYVDNIRVE